MLRKYNMNLKDGCPYHAHKNEENNIELFLQKCTIILKYVY